MSSWLGVFRFGNFLNVSLSDSRCMLTCRASSCPWFFLCYLSVRHFKLCSFSSRNFFPKFYVSFKSDCSFVFFLSPPNCRWNFLYFERICFAWITWSYPVSFLSPFFHPYFLVYFPQLCSIVCCCPCFVFVFFVLFIPVYPSVFFFHQLSCSFLVVSLFFLLSSFSIQFFFLTSFWVS